MTCHVGKCNLLTSDEHGQVATSSFVKAAGARSFTTSKPLGTIPLVFPLELMVVVEELWCFGAGGVGSVAVTDRDDGVAELKVLTS